MERAAASRAEEDAGALEELEFHWGSAYDIAVAGGGGPHGAGTAGAARSPIPLPEGLLAADPGRLRGDAGAEGPAVNGGGHSAGRRVPTRTGHWPPWRCRGVTPTTSTSSTASGRRGARGAGDEDLLAESTPDELNAARRPTVPGQARREVPRGQPRGPGQGTR